MPTFGFVIDNRKCIGCHACTVACKSEHQVPVGVDRTWVKYVEKGTFPNSRRFFSVMRCNHCEWAPCVTICPVTALYRRVDGVVDFNNDRCIGCKSCIQACPYDALYIDPDSNTAAKCNFCTHRLEAGLQPSCVVVCPEQAIIAGDMDDPNTEISRLLDRFPVTVRKPEKGTKPKLFYIEADEASLVPTRTAADGPTMWSRGAYENTDGAPMDEDVIKRLSLALASSQGEPRRAYDVRPRKPSWGWEVVAYTWTKSIAAGSFLAIAASKIFGSESLAIPLGIISIVFLALTAMLLIADLKQPKRFLYVLLRPQWRSWLVRGAYALTAFGAIVTLWLLAKFVNATWLSSALLWPGAVLAVIAAVYTAFLFAQAKGRDFWQNPLLSIHLIAHALLAGSAVWLIVDFASRGGTFAAARLCLMSALAISATTLLAEIVTTPPTSDAHRAMHWIIGKPMGQWFWLGGIACGHVLPFLLLTADLTGFGVIAATLSLAGLFIIEWLWVLAPQHVPLS